VKVVLSVEALTPKLTGIGRYTHELSRGLRFAKNVEDVRFVSNGRWVKDPELLLLPAEKKRPSLLRMNSPRWLREPLMRRFCRNRVVHGPNYFLPTCAEIGVVTIHDLSVFKFPETHPLDRIKQFEREFHRSVSRAAHLITDTETTRREVLQFLGCSNDRITAVPLGVDQGFAPKSPAELNGYLTPLGLEAGGYALCVSTLEPRKNIGQLIVAYRMLAPRLRKHFPLVIAGDSGWLSNDLKRDIDSCRAEGWLHYLGFVRGVDLPLLYAGARVFAYPSSYEGFGLPVLEAMASGVPVVAANCSTLPEVCGGAASLVDPFDCAALSEAIRKALNGDGTTEKIQLGHLVAGERTWSSTIARTAQIYSRLLTS
jgi:glycosyltransferase involved in cell wall biosynthesis